MGRSGVERSDPSIVQVHAEACRAGADTYLDPATGYSVFTARFLLRRRTCCESGCRHCPYRAKAEQQAGEPTGGG